MIDIMIASRARRLPGLIHIETVSQRLLNLHSCLPKIEVQGGSNLGAPLMQVQTLGEPEPEPTGAVQGCC